MVNPIVEIRCLSYLHNGFSIPILVRWHLHIEFDPDYQCPMLTVPIFVAMWYQWPSNLIIATVSWALCQANHSLSPHYSILHNEFTIEKSSYCGSKLYGELPSFNLYMCNFIHWKPRVFMMPTLSSLLPPLSTLGFPCMISFHDLPCPERSSTYSCYNVKIMFNDNQQCQVIIKHKFTYHLIYICTSLISP